MGKFRVGVKYCGNCNTIIDGPALVEKVRERMPDVEFVRYDDPAKDLLLIVSACPVDCASRPDWQGSTLVIAGKTVDLQAYEDTEMAAAVEKKIREAQGM